MMKQNGSDSDVIGPVIHRTNVSASNPNVIIQGPYYRVDSNTDRVPLNDYLEHGYETRGEFLQSVESLVRRWGGRKGECIEERCYHGRDGETIDQRLRQLHLRFHDTPGGLPDMAWLPLYLLSPVPAPPDNRNRDVSDNDLKIHEIDKALWGLKR